MRKITLLILCFTVITRCIQQNSSLVIPSFQNDSALTTTQKKAMKNHQDDRNNPDNMFYVCECFKCNNYFWDTCGDKKWVKDEPCYYGNITNICSGL